MLTAVVMTLYTGDNTASYLVKPYDRPLLHVETAAVSINLCTGTGLFANWGRINI